MSEPLDVYYWNHILSFLHDDHHSLLQLLLTNKSLLEITIRVLYRRPFFDFPRLPQVQKQALENLLLSHVSLENDTPDTLGLDNDHNNLDTLSDDDPEYHNKSIWTVNYLAHVQEMPDRPVELLKWTRFPSEKQSLDRQKHIRSFASKIKKLKVSVDEQKLINQSIRFLPRLERLVFYEEMDDRDQQSTYQAIEPSLFKLVQTSLLHHRKHFPGVLQTVSYLRSGRYGQPCCDPKMMMFIRDIMDGQWSTDRLYLRLPSDHGVLKSTSPLMTLLQDNALPTLLRKVLIFPVRKGTMLDSWTPQLSVLLSRCRVMKKVALENCSPKVLDWAVEEQQSFGNDTDLQETPSPPSSTTISSTSSPSSPSSLLPRTTTTRPLALAQWRQVRIKMDSLQPRPEKLEVYHEDSEDEAVNDDEVIMMEFSKPEYPSRLWSNVLSGFSHSLQLFQLTCVTALNACDPSPFPTISLPKTLYLPRLDKISVLYPNFGDFSALAIPKLRSFIVQNNDGTTDRQSAMDREFPPNLEELQIHDRTMALAGIHSIRHLSHLRTITVYREGDWNLRSLEQQQQDKINMTKAMDQDLIVTDGGWMLPRLMTAYLNGMCGEYLNLNILLIGPNLTRLDLLPCRDSQGQMDFSKFFQYVNNYNNSNIENRSRIIRFPNLKELRVDGDVNLEPLNLGHLLGIVSIVPKEVDEDGELNDTRIMFPGLQSLCLGVIHQSMNPKSTNQFQQFIQNKLQQTGGSGQLGKGKARGAIMKRKPIEFRQRVGKIERAKWGSWLESSVMGFEAMFLDDDGFDLQEIYSSEKHPGLVFKFTD